MLKRNQLPQSWLLLLSFLFVCFCGKSIAADLVSFQVSSNVDSTQTSVDFTLGHVFKAGDVAAGTGLAARLSDGTVLDLQVDKKATHADGSLRHAILSARIPTLQAQSNQTIILSNGDDNTNSPMPLSSLDSSAFDVNVVLQLAQGGRHQASLQSLISAGQIPAQWLAGSVVTEWQFVSPLRNDAGDAHPHLMARFYVRAYSGMDRIRVSVVIENGWTHVTGPQDIDYDLSVLVAGQARFSKQGVTHFHHARWRKVFWWGDEPQLDIRHDTGYLIASKAVPNYDQSLVVPDSIINDIYDKWQTEIAPDSGLGRNELMGPGLVYEYFPATGGRFDIGPFPRWASLYLLSMDPRVKAAMLGTAEQAGSFSIHYRDKPSDRPVTMTDYPSISSMPNLNYMTACGNCNSPYSTDGAHQPSLAYLPYLVTGDYFFLEELQFWSAANMIDSNPGYRDAEKGLVHWRQIRGQAWVLRTLARTAYITPDADEMKAYFTTLVNNNLDWYNDEYSNNVSANKLGINVSGYAFSYSGGTGIAPWQDDHFTWAIGQIAELDFNKADSFLRWKSLSPIARMTADGYCWLDGAAYNLVIRDTNTSPVFDTFAQVYNKNFTTPSACPSVGDMGGYSDSPHGYPSTMRTALAVAVDSGVAGGQAAWDQFMSRTVKPDYSVYPNSAILPRTINNGPNLSFNVSSNAVNAGSAVTLTWSSPGAVSCVASDDWSGSKTNSGSELISALTANRSFTLSCSDAEANSTIRTVNVSIISATDSGVIEFASATQSVGESDATIDVVLTRTNGSYGTVNAEWRTKTFDGFGDADWAADYGTVYPSDTVTFADGETTKIISIVITPDTVIESDETFTVLLLSGDLGSRTSTLITIVDDDTSGGTGDVIAPQISLLGSATLVLTLGDSFTEPGSTVSDNVDLDLTATVSGTVNTASVGEYTLRYNATDTAGNVATEVIRIVRVIAATVATDYHVGPGQALSTISGVPWATLQAGDRIYIHWRDAPYKEKWVISRSGTENNRIEIIGISGPLGQQPVIDGNGAVTATGLNFWNENRGVIKFGGSVVPADALPQYITIDNLEIRGGHQNYQFTDDSGQTQTYLKNSAAIYIEKGADIIIRNSTIHDSGNGIFIGPDNGNSQNILIENNYIYDNGVVGSAYEHNVYTEARGIIFQSNRFGFLKTGSIGNNLKDRSAGTVIRYNWIEGGSRQLDLVDAAGAPTLINDSAYRATHVYGNTLIENEEPSNYTMVHYGGDQSDRAGYRKGTLYFYNNTVISTRSTVTVFIQLSTDDESAEVFNNVFYTSGTLPSLMSVSGTMTISNNWFNDGLLDCYCGGVPGTIIDGGNNVYGTDPLFENFANQNFKLVSETSPLVNRGKSIPSALLEKHNVRQEYVKHLNAVTRAISGSLDIGAHEYSGGTVIVDDSDNDGLPDVWEQQYFGDLTTSNGSTDSDNDGLSDLVEYGINTEPNNPDTDGDGASDGDEVRYGSEPQDSSDDWRDSRPAQPRVGSIDTALLRGQLFFVEDEAGANFDEAQWQISRSDSFDSLVFDRYLSAVTRLTLPLGILDGDSDYWVRTRHYDDLGRPSLWSDEQRFSTETQFSEDSDGNGIDDRYQVDGFVDGNDNAVDDRDEGLCSLQDAEQSSRITFQANSGDLFCITGHRGSDFPAVVDSGKILPYGLFTLVVKGLNIDSTSPAKVAITLYLPEALPVDHTWYNYDGVVDSFKVFSGAVSTNGKRVTLTLTDGGAGDLDGVVNGVIVDPLGVVFTTNTGGTTSHTGSGGNAGGTTNNTDSGGGGTLSFLGLVFLLGWRCYHNVRV